MKEFYENRCNNPSKVKELETFCLEKEKCFNKDPEKLGIYSFLLAKLSGQFVKSFISEFDWKSLIFFSIFYIT